MKIECNCGALICDQTDALPHKAHFVPDQHWFQVLDAIDAAIEQAGPHRVDREAACMKIRHLLGNLSRTAWQCAECGRIYIDDQDYDLRAFVPGAEDVPREIFRTRNTAEPR